MEDADIDYLTLARLMRVPKMAVASMRSGNMPVKILYLVLFADYFGVSLDYLIGVTNEKASTRNMTYGVGSPKFDITLAEEKAKAVVAKRMREWVKCSKGGYLEVANYLGVRVAVVKEFCKGKIFSNGVCFAAKIADTPKSLDWLFSEPKPQIRKTVPVINSDPVINTVKSSNQMHLTVLKKNLRAEISKSFNTVGCSVADTALLYEKIITTAKEQLNMCITKI